MNGASADPDAHRSIELVKIGADRYKAINPRGGVVPIGRSGDPDFTPVELLLVAIAGCAAIDVDLITARRAPAEELRMRVEADKIRDEDGNHLTNVQVTLDFRFPEGPEGDAAREVLPDVIAKTRDRICTVSRTVALPTPVAMEPGRLEG